VIPTSNQDGHQAKNRKKGDEIKKKSSPLKSKVHSTKVWLQLSQWFLRRRFLCEFPIGSYVKLSSAVGAILVEGPNRRTQMHFFVDSLLLVTQIIKGKQLLLQNVK
jgi:hypothetical protein